MKHIIHKPAMRLALAFALCCASLAAQAQSAEVDCSELSFSENLAVPAVPKKAAKPLQKHMEAIRASLHKGIDEVALIRNNEIVRVTLPCSMIFPPNSAVIKESGMAYLRPFLNLLKYPSMYKLLIAVHSDDTGEPGYLDALTEMRANAIDDFLIEESGQSGDNVVPYGMGADDPIEPNNSIANRDRNRRIELYIVPETKLIEQAKAGKL